MASLYLAQNNSVGQRTKHIHIRHRFLHDLVETKQAELRHVRSENNTSDVNSKNTTIDTHEKHATRLYEGLALVEVHDANEPSKEDIESDTGNTKRAAGNKVKAARKVSYSDIVSKKASVDGPFKPTGDTG